MTVRAGTGLFGATEWGVRFFSPLLALGTCLVLFAFAWKLYDETVAIWSVIAFNTIPLLQSGSLFVTSGGPSLFLWISAMLTFWCALEQGPRFSNYWPATGLLLGVAFLNEYSHVVLLLSFLLILVSTRKYRHEFERPGIWSLLLVFILATLPALVWNAHHDWITWFAWRGHLSEAGLRPLRLLRYLWNAALACSPLLLAGILFMALRRGLNKAGHQFKPRFLLCCSLPLLGLELLLSASKSASMDSSAPALLGLVILSVALCIEAVQANEKSILLLAGIALGSGLIQSAGLAGVRLETPDKCSWKTVAADLAAFRKQFERQSGKPVFLIGTSPGIASVLSFYLPQKRIEAPGHPPVYIPESQMIENQFSYWPRYDEFSVPAKDAAPLDPTYKEEQGVNSFMGRNALFISDSAELPTAIRSSFERVEPVPAGAMGGEGHPPKIVHVYQCFNYRTLPL